MTGKSSTDRAPVVLGIETSCDETGVALVDAERRVRAEALYSQLARHAPYGGVVPEIAARAHVEVLDHLIERVMGEAGPGFPRARGRRRDRRTGSDRRPAGRAGHRQGDRGGTSPAALRDQPPRGACADRALRPRTRSEDRLEFPYLLLLVSGGHCQLLVVLGVGRYRRLGTTLDDALGEAYDKAAKMLGLGFPGGPAVERAARGGDANRFALPRPMVGQPGCNFSFSGLKTALRQTIERLGPRAFEPPLLDDLCASFQAAVADVLLDRTRRAAELFRAEYPDARAWWSRAASPPTRTCAPAWRGSRMSWSLRLIVPPPALCTDNGVMVAWAGLERLALGLTDDLAAPARARWPLDPSAEPAPGAGVKA